MNRRIFRAAAALLAVILLCVLCNCIAPLIDTAAMRENAAQGAAMLRDQYSGPQMVGGFKSAQLDNTTAVLMLKTAAYTGNETWLQKAFGGLRTEMPSPDGEVSIASWEAYCTYADGSESPTGGLSYTRYWHGYTLALRLLLCVLNLANIQMLLYFVQTALSACVVVLMLRRGLGAIVPAFFTAYFLMMPFALGVCLQYMTVSMPMLLACAAVLAWDERLDSAIGMPTFFAIVGVVTNYLDLLTFPLASLGFPLVLLIALRLRAGESMPRLLALAVSCCALWGIGFGGMWALKWLISAACFGWDRLHTIVSQIFLRVSSQANGETLPRIGALRVNLDVILGKSSYLLLLGMTGLASLFPAAKAVLARKRLCIDMRALTLLVPLAVSLVWYIVMANHSYDHTYYTYRNLTAGVFAALAFAACLFRHKSE